jgi:hypothetical protein
MNMSVGSAQYIDYVQISSEQDAAVSEIIITPTPTLCDRTNRDVYVVVAATRAQSISFNNTASVQVNVNGTIYPVSLQGVVLAGNTADTLLVTGLSTIPTGNYNIKAYFNAPVDNLPANDTADYLVNLLSDFSINAVALTGGQTNCAAIGFKHNQEVIITNEGNMPLEDVVLKMTVTSGGQTLLVTADTVRSMLSPGASETHTFANAFTIPDNSNYSIAINAYLACDPSLVNKQVFLTECVSMEDIGVIALVTPVAGVQDTVGKEIQLSATLRNYYYDIWYDVVFVADVYTSTGTVKTFRKESIELDFSSDSTFIFNGTYTVPKSATYTIKLYIEKKDNNQLNDTLTIVRSTIDVSSLTETGSSLFMLEQNVPNPAQNKTLIKYSVPADGEISFHVYSVTGQLLYTNKEQVLFGEHQISLDLADYASGIYFYTMEYKGQRLTKRMSVKR